MQRVSSSRFILYLRPSIIKNNLVKKLYTNECSALDKEQKKFHIGKHIRELINAYWSMRKS